MGKADTDDDDDDNGETDGGLRIRCTEESTTAGKSDQSNVAMEASCEQDENEMEILGVGDRIKAVNGSSDEDDDGGNAVGDASIIVRIGY